MKKILITLFMLTILMFSANAGSLVYQDQAQVQSLRDISEGYNIIQQDIFGSDNNNITIGNVTQTFDIREDFVLTDKVYWEYEGIAGEEVEVYTKWGDAETLLKETVFIEENGTYTFLLSPSSEKERLQLMLNYPDTKFDTIEFTMTRERGLADIIVILVTQVVELIGLNLLLWELTIYILAFGVSLFMLFSVVNLMINIHKKIREAKEAKEQHHRKRGD